MDRYRGAAPIYHTLLNKDSTTGVSVIELAEKFDEGKILLQVVHPIKKNTKYLQLAGEVANVGAKCVLQVLSNYEHYKQTAKPQVLPLLPLPLATKIKKSLGWIDWENKTVDEVYTLWLALGDTIGVFSFLRRERFKLLTLLPPAPPEDSEATSTQASPEHFGVTSTLTSPEHSELTSTPTSPSPHTPAPADARKKASVHDFEKRKGQIYYSWKQNLLWISCKDGWIGCSELKREGSKSITPQEFYNGFIKGKGLSASDFLFFDSIPLDVDKTHKV